MLYLLCSHVGSHATCACMQLGMLALDQEAYMWKPIARMRACFAMFVILDFNAGTKTVHRCACKQFSVHFHMCNIEGAA